MEANNEKTELQSNSGLIAYFREIWIMFHDKVYFFLDSYLRDEAFTFHYLLCTDAWSNTVFDDPRLSESFDVDVQELGRDSIMGSCNFESFEGQYSYQRPRRSKIGTTGKGWRSSHHGWIIVCSYSWPFYNNLYAQFALGNTVKNPQMFYFFWCFSSGMRTVGRVAEDPNVNVDWF